MLRIQANIMAYFRLFVNGRVHMLACAFVSYAFSCTFNWACSYFCVWFPVSVGNKKQEELEVRRHRSYRT